MTTMRMACARVFGSTVSTSHPPTTSAVTAGPQQFESILHSRLSTQIPALGASFTANYGAVPQQNNAAPQDRLMMDMDDALAQDNLKTLKETDDAGETELGIANRIENAASQAAPGSAPFLTASAVAASIESQAMTQRMIAAELRQEAARLAHANALRKRGAAYAGAFSNSIQKMLQPR